MFKRDTLKELEKIRRELYIARAKLEMSRRMRSESDYKRVTASIVYTGTIFATPMFMSTLYYNSAIRDVKKILKKLKKVLKRVEEEEKREAIKSVIDMLQEVHELQSTQAILRMREAENLLSTIST